MNPISKTAFYCCGVRMQDAERSNPVCGDSYAGAFMNGDGLRILEAFKDETNPNASNVATCRCHLPLTRPMSILDVSGRAT